MFAPAPVRPSLPFLFACALALAVVLPAATGQAQRTVNVSDAGELSAAFSDAMPGDDIVLADGTYVMGHRLDTGADGTSSAPVTVRPATRDGATVEFRDGSGIVEGFVVQHAFWRFEGLRIESQCSNDSRCEHAWHLVGGAEATVIRGCTAEGFNAHIKSNGSGSPRDYPDDVLVEGNEFYNDAPRMTANPVTPIDIVGGRRWVVRANFIHDFAKGMGNNISYAAFLKGNSRDGLFEQNLVVCELLHSGQIRLGLSFGGGGTNPDSVCEDGDCSVEHQNGIMRNNVISHCPADVGIYVNECQNCAVVHNTVFGNGPNGGGIDLRFATTDVEVEGNLVSGRIRDRDGATSTRRNNLERVDMADFASWFRDPAMFDFALSPGQGASFVDQGGARSDVNDDFCGNARDDGMPDIGAVEYDGDGPCDTTRVHVMRPVEPGTDAGPADSDAGPGTDGGPTVVDAGTGSDAGPRDGGGTGALDGGEPGGGSDGGCAVSPAGAPAGSGALWLALALGWMYRRRAAQRGSATL